MASRPKRKQPNHKGTITGSLSPTGGVFGFSPPEVSSRDGRKKRKDKMSWEKFTLTPYHDGHLWRKYGQKTIKGSPFPRLYFKCSYYEDKHCMATKLMQQHNDDVPPLFKVTYIYEHTCNVAPVPAPAGILTEAELPAATSCNGLLLRFDAHGGGWMQQEPQYRHQPMSLSPFQMLSFDPSNSQQQQQHAFPFDVRAPARAAGSSSSLPITKSSSGLSLPTNNEGDILSTWNSFRSAIEDHLFDDDQEDFPCNILGSTVSAWDTEMDVHSLDIYLCMHEGDVVF